MDGYNLVSWYIIDTQQISTDLVEMGFVYDLKLPHQSSSEYVNPKINDGEVESFTVG